MSPRLEHLLVTVGTTSFDDLLRAADDLVPTLEPVDGLMQVGEGEFVPKNLPHERFVPNLRDHYARSSLVIAHGGAATTFEVLRAGVPLVSAANGDRYDDHQTDLLSALHEAGHLVWCEDLARLGDAVETALTTELVPLPEGACTIGDEIRGYLEGVGGRRSILRRLVFRTDRPARR